jgi:hypothetical protein
VPLPLPTLDDRSYQEILRESLARIPVHNPEWTNYNDSDPGVTLVQLFAFMTESLLYRANRIPERNRLRFLRLLGIGLRPAVPAQALVTFAASGATPHARVVPAGTPLHAGQVPFRTRTGLEVLPVEARVFVKAPAELSGDEAERTQELYEQLYDSALRTPSGALADAQLYETRPLPLPSPGAPLPTLDLSSPDDTVDGALWIALLAPRAGDVEAVRGALGGRTLTLGIVPALDDAGRVLAPGQPLTDPTAELNLRFERPDPRPDDAEPVARYAALPARPLHNVLAEPGLIELQLPPAARLRTWTGQEPTEAGVGAFPPSLEDLAEEARIVTWIRVRAREGDSGAGAQARIGYAGINAALAEQREEIAAEFLGMGTGEPDQQATLVNTPVLPESVVLTVNGEPWAPIDDLAAAPPEVARSAGAAPAPSAAARVYTLDRATGEVRFGDGLRGARPPREAVIQAQYAFGGGAQGVVGVGALRSGELPSGLTVTNPVSAWGGSDAETVEQAERRIPGHVQHRDRLVTEGDVHEITLRTPGVAVGRVEVRALARPAGSDGALSQGVPGALTVLVVPQSDPLQPDAPVPGRLFLAAVCAHLDARRLLTTEIHVRGPAYVPVYVSAGIEVVPGQDLPTVREAVADALRVFLSPLTGGFEEEGWPLAHDVDARELYAVAARTPGVSGVRDLLLGGADGIARERIALSGLRLPHLVGLSVQAGDPQPLAELAGSVPEPSGPPALPVPYVPTTC